jgi:hypothetical protein
MYVQRNPAGTVVGVSARPQPGIATEQLADDHADIVGFFSAPLVPQVVTMRQARLALLGAGLLAGVDAAIAALPGPTKAAATIEWEYAATVERNSALVTTLARALKLDGVALDALFVAAAVL